MSFFEKTVGFEGENKEIIKKALEKAGRLQADSVDGGEIDMNDFRRIYGDQVDVDAKRVDELKKRFTESNSQEDREALEMAQVLEAIILNEAELNDWLGPNAFTTKTSQYDDYVNGVDLVLEFAETPTSSAHVALAIDVTFNNSVSKKFRRITEEIKDKKFGEIKYFASESSGFQGRLSKVVKVVVDVDVSTLRDLAKSWIDMDVKDSETKNRAKKALEKHFIQYQILEEIVLQLNAFSQYAEIVGSDDIARAYDNLNQLISGIYGEKLETDESNPEINKRDAAFDRLKAQLQTLPRKNK